MARSGRPRKHDPIADEIRRAIDYATTADAVALVRKTDIDVLDGDSRTPLIHAALAGNTELLEWLLTSGANIDHQDRNGWSSLHFAVQEKHMEAIQFLLKSGAAVDPKDVYGNTPLWRAAFDARDNYEIVKLLLAHGADPHSKNKSDRSPLDHAEAVGDDELVSLLKAGCSLP